MSNPNVIKFTNIDSVNSGYKNTSGWFKKEQTSNSPSNREVDRHPILRVKNVDKLNAVSGVIRFNEENAGGPVFEGYDGIKWNSFNNVPAINGVNGLNYKTIVEGENLVNSDDSNINYHSIFKNVITTIKNEETLNESNTLTEQTYTVNIHRIPTFKYDSSYKSKQFNLSNHNIIFEPNDTTNYKVYVKKNESWPPVDYSSHTKYSQINNSTKLEDNSYIPITLSTKFKFYNREYNTVYINQNGYLTFGIGESSFIYNILPNHFSKYRISAMFLNLLNDKTSQSSSLYTTNDSDIFLGYGKNGEYIITFQNYLHNPGTENHRIDFQIRLFLKRTTPDANNMYSDDYYPEGTIQISYNNNPNLTNISPIVGISDSSGYDSTNFTELYFSNLLTNNRDINTETGIPFLRTFLNIQLNNNDEVSKTNLNTKYPTTELTINQDIDSTSNTAKYKLILDDLETDIITINDTTYGTSYQEDNYYIKTINLGDINLQKLSIAIRSDFDYEPKKNNSVVHYSDSTNYFLDKEGTTPNINNITLDTNWKQIPDDKFIDVNYIYETSNNKDYFNIYDNLTTNSNFKNRLYNSNIYRIQARYQKQMNMSTPIPTINNNLILKIIYILNSDNDNNTGTTISNALSLSFTKEVGGNNYGPFNYINNDIDLFLINRINNPNAKFIARIYDFNMTSETTQINSSDEVMQSRTLSRRIEGANSNISLTLELLDSNGLMINKSNPTDTKESGTLGEEAQSLKFFNQITKSDPLNTEIYYLKVTGTHNLGYYGISLIDSLEDSTETQVSNVYINHKFSRINETETEALLPLKSDDTYKKLYSITKSNNLLFLMPDTTNGKMRFYNYDFSGSLKEYYKTDGANGVETDYSNNQEILDMQFMGDKVLVARKNETNINIDIFDFDDDNSDMLENTITSTSSTPHLNKVYMRILTDATINYGLIAYISASSENFLNIYKFKEGESSLTINNIKKDITEENITGSYILDNIVNFVVFDKDNIFLIGNKSPYGKIIKLSYNTTDNTFSPVGTIKNVAKILSPNAVNKILYAEKYEDTNGKYLVLFYEEGSNAEDGYCISIIGTDLSNYYQYDNTFDYDTSRVITNNNIIFNFKVKYGMILILWQDTNEERFFQSYKLQLNPENKINKVKTSQAYIKADYLMDVVLHNITLNDQQENIYIIIRKYLTSDDTVFKLLIQIIKETTNNVIIQFTSTTNYLIDLTTTIGETAIGKSIFNHIDNRKFEITNELNKLIKDPIPILSSINDEQLFFFGFDASNQNLILEGFGKLNDIIDTGIKIESLNQIKNVGDSTSLSFNDISEISNFATINGLNLNTTTTLKFDPGNPTSSTDPEYFDLLDVNTESSYKSGDLISSIDNSLNENVEPIKNYLRKMDTSMATIKKTVGTVTTYYTGVIYGPKTLDFKIDTNIPIAGYSNRFLSGIIGTFSFDIYSNTTYIKQNQYTITAVTSNLMTRPYGKNLEVIPIENGFLLYYIDWNTTLSGSPIYGHILVIKKFIVSISGEWTDSTKNIPLYKINISTDGNRVETEEGSPSEWPFYALNHCFIDDGGILMLTFNRCEIVLDSYIPIFFFIKISNLEATLGNNYTSYTTSGSLNYNDKFNSYLLSGSRPSPLTTVPVDLGSGSYKITNLTTMKHFSHATKKLLYIIEYWNPAITGIHVNTLSIIRCEKDGTDGVDTEYSNTMHGNSYFKSDKINHKFIEQSSSVLGTLYNIDSYNEGPGPYKYLFTNNLTYKDTSDSSNVKFHIYFMAGLKPEYYKYSSTYYVVDSSNKINVSGVEKSLKFSYGRIFRLTIGYNSTFSSETYTLGNSHNFPYEDIVIGNVATQGPVMDNETLILSRTNLSQFNIIMDGDSRYIIASSHANVYESNNNLNIKTNRENIDFIIYKVRDDAGNSGDLVLVCYGKQQRILSIHIESGNLVLFVPSDDNGNFDSNGKFTRTFKKPLVYVNPGLSSNSSENASNIILGSGYSPEIIEPENDTTNTLYYPQFFTNINNSSKFIYNGDCNLVDGVFEQNAPSANQITGLKYNIVVGYSPSPDGSEISYGDNKSFGIISFGTFTVSSSGSGSGSGSSIISTITSSTSISGKLLHFNSQLGNSTDSSFVIGRYRNSTFNTNEDDTGVIFYSYNISLSLTTDASNFYVRTNSIPNYEPIYSGNNIKGSWNNELSDNTNENYSIMPQNYGWLTPKTLIENGKYFIIPHTIKNVNTKSILLGTSTILETFWHIGDENWDAIMVNPGYYDSTTLQNNDSSGYYITNLSLLKTNINDKLLTPIGRIGVGVNGVVFYNFSNLERNKNAIKDLKSDIFGGMGDSLHSYHYHSWPVNLEGMMDLGHPDTSVQGSDYGRLPTLTASTPDLLVLTGSVTYPKYIYGMTYYFNQIDRSNFDSTTVNKFAIKFEPVFKGTIHRFKVRQVKNEYYLTPIDFAGTTTGSEKRRLVISKIKQGDTIIFNHDVTCTKLITITGDVSDPSTAWGNYATINVTDTSFAHSTVTTGDNTIAITSHNFNTGDEVIYIEGITAISGLTTNTKYYIIDNTINTIKLASTLAEANSTTPIILTSQGVGTHIIRKLSDIKTSTISQIRTAGNDGALTYFNVPYNFDLGFLRYQPSGLGGGDVVKDWGSYIITGSFYEYNVALAGTDTEKYYTLTPEGGTIIAGTTSPVLTNIKFGDLVLFDQPDINSTYGLKIKTESAVDSNTDPDNSSLFFQNTLFNKQVTFANTVVDIVSNYYIQITAHGYSNKDKVFYIAGSLPIKYSVGGTDVEIPDIVYVNVVDSDNIRLATDVDLTNLIAFKTNGTGTHALSDIKYLYFSPMSAISISNTTLYYTTNADVSSVVLTGGPISLATYSRPDEYSFNNTLIRHGTPGNSYCPYTKFTIPNFSDIKVNKLVLTLNSNSNKYEIYGNLNNNRYTPIKTSNIYVKLNVKQTYNVSASDVNIVNNTITINSHGFITGNIITYTQGTTKIGGLDNNRNYYVIRIDDYTIKLSTSEGLANAKTNINFTTTGTGSHTFKILGIIQRYEFYGKYNNTGYYETSSTEKITDLQLFNGTKYIFDVSDNSMNGIILRFSSLNTTFSEVLSYSTANNKITTDITGIVNDTLLYAFNSSDATNTNILGSTVITVKTAHSQFLTELKLFRNTKYIIDVSLLESPQRPLFSTTLPATSITPYNFPYYGIDTFNHDTTSSLISFTIGDDINSLYIYNSEDTTDTINKTMGSNYETKIYSEKIYDLLNKIRITDLSVDATGDSGSDINTQDLESNVINVNINGGKFEFFAIDQSEDTNHKFDYYLEDTSNNITTLKLYNNTKYIIKYSTGITGTDNILKFTSSSTQVDYLDNNITFDDTYDNSVANQISFVVKGLTSKTQTIYAYNGKLGQEAVDMTGTGTTSIKAQNPKPINIYTDVNSSNLRFFRNPAAKDYFNGYLDYENAGDYITKKLVRTGAAGHSPLLGYAFDGYPIYGPLGYDKDDSSYNSSATTLAAQSSFKVKLMKSSYTGGNDNDGNPMYIQGSGDLDICNGFLSLTPEFPNGIYHYVCTIELNADGSQKLSLDSNYGYLNSSIDIIKPSYPYAIGAYKGIPNKSNFNTLVNTTTNASSSSSQITTYKINFKSLKSENNKFNGTNFTALDIYSDDSYLNLCPRPHPYIWNFTSDQIEDSFFGKSNKDYGNTIINLRSSTNDIKFKAYGNVSKWICKENISKGMAVRLVNNNRNITVNNVITTIKTLEIELYDSRTSPSESSTGAAFLGISLNDAINGSSCFVCTSGITTVKIGKTLSTGIKCGSYGTLVFSSFKGYVIPLGLNDVILPDVAIAGYFLEELSSVVLNQLVLFNVQGNYQYN